MRRNRIPVSPYLFHPREAAPPPSRPERPIPMTRPYFIAALSKFALFAGFLLLSASPLPAAASGAPQPEEINRETIRIGESTFTIPEPWSGNRIHAPARAMSEFAQIPTDHTKNETRLYVVKEAHTALLSMMQAAKADGIILLVESGYRSQGYQKKIFSRMLGEGRSFDDIIRYVAPPGYSEHALGTAVDFYPSNWEFARLPDYAWLRENGARYGFKETYPRRNSMNYPWEAWHWRYHPDIGAAASASPTTPETPSKEQNRMPELEGSGQQG